MPFGWVSAAGAVIGGLSSMSAADSQAEAAEKAKNPWSGAEPWIRDNIATGQQLQQYYQQNPFNSIQQQGMQGLLSGYEHQNNQVIPGLMGFANNLMGQNYQRGAPQGRQPGLMSAQIPSGATQQGGPQGMQQGMQQLGGMSAPDTDSMLMQYLQRQPAPQDVSPEAQQAMQQSMGSMSGSIPSGAMGQPGMMGMMQKPAPAPQGMQGGMQPMQGGPFTPPPMQGSGPVNWNAMNPLYKDPAAAPPPPAPIPEGEAFRLAMADALFPESENKFKFGIGGPSLSELELRRMLGRPSNFVDVSG